MNNEIEFFKQKFGPIYLNNIEIKHIESGDYYYVSLENRFLRYVTNKLPQSAKEFWRKEPNKPFKKMVQELVIREIAG